MAALALLVLAPGCQSSAERDTATVEARLAEYTGLVLQMNHHAIATLYAADGELGNPGQDPIRGPQAIEKFLRGFDAYQVLAYSTVADTTLVHGDAAYQAGSYRQRVRLPSADTVEVHGRFRIEWVRDRDRWLIKRMGAVPER